MTHIFEEVPKKLGFGFMRLPMIGEDVDIPQVKDMVDLFLSKGFTYFDTAHGYLGGKSELALRECLTTRYPREAYQLADKLSFPHFSTQEEIRPLFQQQLDACGVDYFDYYLMHAQSAARMDHYRKTKAYETAAELKAEGRIRHLGISFHDSAAVLEEILTEYPQVEFVQLQFNYVDFDDPKVQARKCYAVCQKFGKAVTVMEPVKGGSLVNLPIAGQRVFDRLKGGSNASYAIRFAAGFDSVQVVLSGMSTLEQVRDNASFMENFQPLTARERDAVDTVCAIYRNQGLIDCTNCRYCMEVCPQAIPVPEIFAQVNAWRQDGVSASLPEGAECLRCGKCQEICPQQLPIRQLLRMAREELQG